MYKNNEGSFVQKLSKTERLDEAFKWYEKAAEQGNKNAKKEIQLYEKEKNTVFSWLKNKFNPSKKNYTRLS